MDSIAFTEPQTKQCLFCAETIQAAAIKCRFCGEFLNTDKAKALEAGNEQDSQSPENEKTSDKILFKARPSLWAMAGAGVKGLFFIGIAYLLLTLPLESIANDLFELELTDSQALAFADYRRIAGIVLIGIVILGLLAKIVRLKSTYYEVTEDRIEYSRGIFDRRVDNLDMFRVIDLKLRRSLLDCIFGIGAVGLITNDKTDPEFVFEKVRNSRRLYDCIKKASLEADRRNTVVHLE